MDKITNGSNGQACDKELVSLMKLARDARKFAYCPYSKFHVGAALLCHDGKIFSGANIENASYGLTICAERVAMATAVAAGYRSFKAMAFCCDVSGDFKAPCGACRQFIIEFGAGTDLYAVKPDLTWKRLYLEMLLPLAFIPDCLLEERESP